MYQILIKRDLEELSSAAADLFSRIANESIDRKGFFSVALSGGTTPRSLFSLLASDRYRDTIDWSKVKIFFGDERTVPPDSPESNYRMARETLLDPLGIPEENVYPWQTGLDPNDAADLYQKVLEENGPLDLVLLGLGSDAHTASLFPNTAALREKEKLAVANWVEELKTYRLTLTFPAIDNSSNVIFIVSGADKATALANVLDGEFRPEELPAQFVLPFDGELYWLVDEAAASQIKEI